MLHQYHYAYLRILIYLFECVCVSIFNTLSVAFIYSTPSSQITDQND